MLQKVFHTIEPVYNKNSKILILGSMPSPKSRQAGFFYSHPQNRFWKVISDIFQTEYPATIDDKKELLLKNRIALWDVLKCCDIEGAEDSSIKNPIPNDLSIILESANIKAIFTTGKKAYSLYKKFNKSSNQIINSTKNIDLIGLPSTSGANCSKRYDELLSDYKAILKYIK